MNTNMTLIQSRITRVIAGSLAVMMFAAFALAPVQTALANDIGLPPTGGNTSSSTEYGLPPTGGSSISSGGLSASGLYGNAGTVNALPFSRSNKNQDFGNAPQAGSSVSSGGLSASGLYGNAGTVNNMPFMRSNHFDRNNNGEASGAWAGGQ